MGVDRDAQREIEHDVTQKPGSGPVAGPHAEGHLTDNEKTPGTGALPDSDGVEADVGSD